MIESCKKKNPDKRIIRVYNQNYIDKIALHLRDSPQHILQRPNTKTENAAFVFRQIALWAAAAVLPVLQLTYALCASIENLFG